MKIVVLDGFTLNPGDNPWTPIEALGELVVYPRTPADQILSRIGDTEIVLTNKTPLRAETIELAPNLRFISVLATGYNVVDVAAAQRRNILVSNVPIYGTDTVAQHVFAMLLHWIHQTAAHDTAIHNGEWQRRGEFSFWLNPLYELAGKTMGIVGWGRIGQRTAEIARAFGMTVIAHSRTPRTAPDWPGFRWLPIAELFSQADVVSLHCPQTDDNVRFVNAQLLSRMKPSAILINTARGSLIDEHDLAAALNHDQLQAACLDVVSQEPIIETNPLLQAKNCLLTPHCAWAAVEARRRLMAITAQNIAAFQAGTPIHLVG